MVDLDEVTKPKKKWGTTFSAALLAVLIMLVAALIVIVIIKLEKNCDKCVTCEESSPSCSSNTVEPLYFTLVSTKVNYTDAINGNYTNVLQSLSSQIHDALTNPAVRSRSAAFTNFDGSNSNILPVAILGISPSPTGFGVVVIGSTVVTGQNLLSPQDATNRLTSHNLTAYVINSTQTGTTPHTQMCQQVNPNSTLPAPTQSPITTTSMQPPTITSTVISTTSTPAATCPTCTCPSCPTPPPTPPPSPCPTTSMPSSAIPSTATQPVSSSSSSSSAPFTSSFLSTLTTLTSSSSSATSSITTISPSPSMTTASSQSQVSSASPSLSTLSATIPSSSSSASQGASSSAPSSAASSTFTSMAGTSAAIPSSSSSAASSSSAQSTSTSSVTSTSTTPTTTCSPPPTQSPPYPCQANIILLLDASGGMTPANFSLQQQFIANELLDAGWTFTQLAIGAYDDANQANFQALSPQFGTITTYAEAQGIIENLNHYQDPASIATGLQRTLTVFEGQQPCVKQVTVVFASTSDPNDVAAARPFANQLQDLGPVIIVVMGPNVNGVILSSLATPGALVSWRDFNDTTGLATKILLAFNCNTKVQHEEALIDV